MSQALVSRFRVYTRRMRYALARFAALLPILGGCSLIYNESNIPTPESDAGPDAEIDAEIIVDADPSMVMITGAKPSVITEGQGAGGSRKAIIVIDGQHMVKANLMVMVTANASATKVPMLMVDLAGIDVEANGRRLAVPITLPVDDRGATGLNAGDMIPLDITVIQTVPGGPTITRMLPSALNLRGLNELRGTSPAGGFPASSEYSEINLTGGTVGGTTGLIEPVVIRATASITLGSTVTTTVSAALRTPGPAGGLGGMGGAALGNPGMPGAGPAPGAPSGGIGRYEGDEQLTSLKDKNRGSGGAGGDGSVLGAGGDGGGGGGSIALLAGGDVTVGNITARGGMQTTTGGGGSGGVVLVRAGGNLMAGTIDVTSAGSGQPGRGRFDAKAGMPGNASSLFRGPMFVDPPLISNEQKPMVTVVGQASKTFKYFFTSAEGLGESILFSEDLLGTGTKTFPLAGPLFPGLNTLCLVVDGGDKTSETRNCVDIALLYKPPAQ